MRASNILMLFFLFIVIGLKSQVIQPYNKIFQTTQRGGIFYLSNASIYCKTKDTLALPPSSGIENNYIKSFYIDRDNDPSTFSASSDSLALADCSDILYVGIFWGGLATSTTPNWTSKNQIKLKIDNSQYIDVATEDVLVTTSSLGTSYHCYKDITSIIKQFNKNRFRITVANIVAITDVITDGGSFGGWNVVVAYKNDSENQRQLTVYKGLTLIDKKSPPVDNTLSGFVTPVAGPVTFELGIYGYEGDRPYVGDQLLVGDGTNFQNISDNIHNFDNIFNSTISRNGVLTPYRIPNYNNNFSIDANVFFPNNTLKKYIGNGASSIVIRQMTQNEAYLTQCFSLAIDALSPDNRLGMRVKDLNGGIVQPGDTLEYTLVASNQGTDFSHDTYITDTIEGNAYYVPNSIKIVSGYNAGAKTDQAKDDQAEYDAITRSIKVRIGAGAGPEAGGSVNYQPTAGDSTVIKFRVTASDNCIDLKCDNIIDNHAFVIGKGEASGLTYKSDRVPSYFDGSTCSIKDISNQSSVIIFSDCTLPSATSNSPVCANSPIQLIGPYSPNASYYWSGPNGFNSTSQNPIIQNAKAAASGVYTLRLTFPNKICSGYNYTTLVVVNDGDIANAGQDQSICSYNAQLAAEKPKLGKGTWALIGNGTGVTIDSPTSYNSSVNFTTGGSYSFEWSVSNSGCVTRDTMKVRVGLNCPPVLDNERHIIKVNETASGDLTDGGDSSFGDCFTVNTSPLVLAKHGDIAIQPSGSYTYTPRQNYVGKDTVVVSICDCQTPPLCGKDTVFITIEKENHVPIAVNDTSYNRWNIDLTLNDTPSADGGNEWTKTKDPDHGKVVITPDGKCIYTPEPGFIGVDVFKYKITDVDGDVSEAIVFVKVFPFFIPEGFSPNGDGPHDRFEILGIENYPKNKFSIFNRWGNKVYEASPYLNDWDGTNTMGLSVGGNVLPVGTYFYILDLGDGSKVYKGTIYLNR